MGAGAMAEEGAAVLESDPYVAHTPHALPFWQAAARGVLLLPRCEACGRVHWYPRPFCPFCASTAVRWEESPGRGRVYSFTSLRRAPGPPKIIAYIRLDEGPLMLTNLVGCAPDGVAIDDHVRVGFVAAREGRRVPVFARDGG